jgi:phenylpropionate dioxygenase-like ring-hydroxylating dioxygenase large terminal subunit
MLSKEDNQTLTQVGPGTLIGDLMRQYWLPALMTTEVPAPDSPPVRLRLLGEDMIGFRTTSGPVGIVANACPHRGASLFFGRNEEDGLRCVYHGWKFDVTGACVDMPSEPAESNFKSKVRVRAYPTEERNGIVWVYMGPREVPPPLPGIEPNLEEGATIQKFLRDCSWLQGFEGDLDTTHIGFLHFGAYSADEVEPKSMDYYTLKRRDPKMTVVETPWGATYGSYRPAEEDTTYWRVAQYLYPFYSMPPVGVLGARRAILAIVPVDDTHMMRWQISIPNRWASNGVIRPAYQTHPEYGYMPETSGFLGKWRMAQNRHNDYLLDRDLQMKGKSYTGILGIGIQDEAVTESMGAIVDRSKEHLGTSDLMVIRLRQLLMRAAKRLRDSGEVPPAVDHPEVYAVRSGGVVLPNGINGIEATLDLQQGRVSPEDFGSSIKVPNFGV